MKRYLFLFMMAGIVAVSQGESSLFSKVTCVGFDGSPENRAVRFLITAKEDIIPYSYGGFQVTGQSVRLEKQLEPLAIDRCRDYYYSIRLEDSHEGYVYPVADRIQRNWNMLGVSLGGVAVLSCNTGSSIDSFANHDLWFAEVAKYYSQDLSSISLPPVEINLGTETVSSPDCVIDKLGQSSS